MYDDKSEKLTLYTLRPGVNGSLEIFKSIEISCDMKYTVYIAGLRVPTLLKNAPPIVSDVLKLKCLLEIVNASKLCIGNPDSKFEPLVQSRNGKFLNRSGKLIAIALFWNHCVKMFVLTGATVASEELKVMQSSTIRHAQCTLLSGSKNHRCAMCTKYRATLRSLLSHNNHGVEEDSNTAASSHVNFRYLSKAQKL